MSAELQKFLDAKIAEIKDELNELAMMGAMPLWSSFIVRLDQLAEDLRASPPPSPAAPWQGVIANDDPEAMAALQMDAFDRMTDVWAEEVDLPAMIKNATSPMDLKPYAPDDVRQEFRQRMEAQINAIARQCFLEGAVRASLPPPPSVTTGDE